MVPFTVGALGCAALLGLGNGAVFKLVPEHFPKETGTVTGLVGALGGLGGFFPPLLLGVFRDTLGVIWPGLRAARRRRRWRCATPTSACSDPATRWSEALPARAPRAVERLRAGAWATLVDARAGRGDRRRLAQPRSTSTPRWSATRSPRSSPPSASPTATRCGCSGRRRGCTGGAAGRCSSRAARSLAQPRSARPRARWLDFAAQPLHLAARPAARRWPTG